MIETLTNERKDLYKERKNGDEQTKIQAAQRIEQINAQLKSCRRDVGICKKIFEDAERIKAKYGEIRALSAQKVNMERAMKDEHERRSR